MENNFFWNDIKVIDFVNWFIDLHDIDPRFCLENMEIVNSFKRGESVNIWKKNKFNCFLKNIKNETNK